MIDKEVEVFEEYMENCEVCLVYLEYLLIEDELLLLILLVILLSDDMMLDNKKVKKFIYIVKWK